MFATPGSRRIRKTAKTPVKSSVLYQSKSLTIKLLSHIPHLALTTTPTSTNNVSFDIDTYSGFIVMNGSSQVYVWSATNLLIPYITLDFLPTSKVILSCLLNFNTQTGLIGLNQDGFLRFWPNVDLRLQHQQIDLELSSSPLFITQCENNGVLVGLENGSVVRIVLDKADQISYHLLSRRTVTRALFGFFGSGYQSDSILSQIDEKLLKVVMGSFGVVYVLTSKVIQKWSLGNSEVMQWEHDLIATLKGVVREFGIRSFEVLDMAYGFEDKLVCLARYEDVTGTFKYLILTLLELDGIEIYSMKDLSIDNARRITLSVDVKRPIAYVTLEDQFMVISLLDKHDYFDVVPLKSKDLIGCRVSLDAEQATCYLLCHHAGVLQVKLEDDVILAIEVDVSDDLYSRLEQLVFSSKDNPISLDLKAIESDLNGPSLQLSRSIMDGSNSNLVNLVDDGYYLEEVCQRGHDIIVRLSQYGLVNQLSAESRDTLISNMEQLVAMKDLWLYQNGILSDGGCPYLANGVTEFIVKESLHCDFRSFYKEKSHMLTDFLIFLEAKLCRECVDIAALEMKKVEILELGKLFTICYTSFRDYRDNYSVELYAVNSKEIDWTFSLSKALQRHYELVLKVVQLDDIQLLPNLTRFMLHTAKKTKNDILINKAVDSLVLFGLEDDAFSLAEESKDLNLLVKLSLNNEHKLKSSFDKFGYAFATTLYDYYVATKNYNDLLLDKNIDYLQEYLKEFEGLSWILNIDQGKYAEASKSLSSLSNQYVSGEGLTNAISKLAYLSTPEASLQELNHYEIIGDLVQLHTTTQADLLSNDDQFKHLKKTSILKRNLAKDSADLIDGKLVCTSGLVDILTCHFPAKPAFFIDAMTIANNESNPYFTSLVWQRSWLSEDWDTLGTLSDQDLINHLKNSVICLLIVDSIEKGFEVLKPSELKLVIPVDLEPYYTSLTKAQVKKLRVELQELDRNLDGLDKYYNQIMHLLDDSIMTD